MDILLPPGRPHPVLSALAAVHDELGRGARRDVYEAALAVELRARRIGFERDVATDVWYHGQLLETGSTVSFVLDADLPLDVRVADRLTAADETPTLHHLRSRGGGHGVVANFGGPRLQVRRVQVASFPPAIAESPPGIAGA